MDQSIPQIAGQFRKDGGKLRCTSFTCLCHDLLEADCRYLRIGSKSWIENLSIKQGDILISRGNGSKSLVGLAGLVGDTSIEPETILFPDTMIRARLNDALCDVRFFVLMWNSRIVRDQIEGTARTTAGIHKISQTDIERFEIPLPSLEDQVAIVKVAEEALPTLGHSAQVLESLATKSSSLRASILSVYFHRSCK